VGRGRGCRAGPGTGRGSRCAYAGLTFRASSSQADNINALIKAAGVKGVEPYWAGLFEKLCASVDVGELLTNVGSGGGGGGDAGAGAAAAAPEPEEEPEEEDMEFDLFD